MLVDIPRHVTEYYHQYSDQSVALYQSVRDTQVSLLSAMMLAGSMLLIFFLMLWDLSRSRKTRDRHMDREHGKHNKVLVQSLLAEALVDANLKVGLKGPVLSDKDYRYWCKRLAQDYGFTNLLPRKRMLVGTEHVKRLKEKITRRLKHQEPDSNIPGPKPGEAVVVPKPSAAKSLDEVFKQMKVKAA